MNPYQILGVDSTSTLDEIKRVYRKKAMKFHPDRGGDESIFKQINHAYVEILSYHETQKTNDLELEWDISDDEFDDLAVEHSVQNQDLAIKVHISLKDSYNGSVIETRYELLSGKFQTVELTIPKGLKSNEVIHYTGLGDDSIPLMPRGNLVVTIVVDNSDNFIRRGDDLCTTISISVFEAMIGTIKTVNGLDGEEYNINIHPGVQPNHEIIFSNCGFYNYKKNKYGNFIIIVTVDVPSIKDDIVKDILMNLHNAYYN